jgi:pimeloyl-ACP methyl ester carboxylesterase
VILNFSRLGVGHPLIILHGLYGSGDNWLTIAKGLSSVCEVYLVDQRNHGRSFHSDIHDYKSMAGDLKELMDSLEIRQAVILGHSMGGKTAMHFAAENPARVTKLIIADISPRTYRNQSSDLLESDNHGTILRSLLSLDLQSVNSLGDADAKLKVTIPDKQLRQFLLKNLDRNPESDFRWKLNLTVLLDNLKNLNAGMEQYLNAGTSFTQYPTLFIRGEQSNYISEADRLMIRQLYPLAQ